MNKQSVVIIKGSRSDREYCTSLGNYLQDNGWNVIHRTGSAHRTPNHVLKTLKEYDNDENVTTIITVAGLSDALSGMVAANTTKPVIAFPPDLKAYGEAKVFSSTRVPKGIKVFLAKDRAELIDFLRNKALMETYTTDELDGRKMKIVETFYTDNQEGGIDYPLGLPLFGKGKGKVRDMYEVGGDKLLINSTDRISAFDVNSVTEIEGKGRSLNLLSEWWFKQTNDIFPNHYISSPDPTMMLAKKADRINIEWVIRGYLYGSMYREYSKGERHLYGHDLPEGLQLAEKLPEVMLTPTTKADVGHDMPIMENEATNLGLVSADEWKALEEGCHRLYDHYTYVADQKGFIIPDFKLEFGRCDGNLIQIDEAPNHDSARIWIKKHHQVGKRQEGWCADKEFYRQFLIDSGIDTRNPPNPLPEIPEPVVREIQKRLGLYEVFTKDKNIDEIELRSLEDVETELVVHHWMLRKEG